MGSSIDTLATLPRQACRANESLLAVLSADRCETWKAPELAFKRLASNPLKHPSNEPRPGPRHAGRPSTPFDWGP